MEPTGINNTSLGQLSKPAAAVSPGKQPKQLDAALAAQLNSIIAMPKAPAKTAAKGLRKAEVIAGEEASTASGKLNDAIIKELEDRFKIVRKKIEKLIKTSGKTNSEVVVFEKQLARLEEIAHVDTEDADRELAKLLQLVEELEAKEAEQKRELEAMDRGHAAHLALLDKLAQEAQEAQDRLLAESLSKEQQPNPVPAAAVAVPAAAATVILDDPADDDFEKIEKKDDDGFLEVSSKNSEEYKGLFANIYSILSYSLVPGNSNNKKKDEPKK